MCWLLRRTHPLYGKESSTCVPRTLNLMSLTQLIIRNINLSQARPLNILFVAVQEVDVKIPVPLPMKQRSTQNLIQRRSL